MNMPRFVRGGIPAAVVGLGLALLPAVAAAADPPRIGLVGMHQASMDEVRQLRLAEQLIVAIEGAGAWDAAGPGEVAAAIAGRESIVLEEGLLSSARAALQGGKSAYNQASTEDAIALLEQAIDGYRRVFSGAFVVEDLWEAWVYLGTSQLQRDPPDEAAARRAFSSALALLPNRPLNPALYPPHVIETFDAVRADLVPHGVKLEITLAADGPATVWIDGTERGQTPLTVTDVLPGEHFVVATGDRREAFARLDVPMPGVPQDGGAPTALVQQVPLALAAPVLAEPAGSVAGRSAQAAALYGALAHRSEGLDYVLLSGVQDGVLSLQLLRVSDGSYSKSVELPLAGDAGDAAVQAVPLLLGAIRTDGSFAATAAAPAPLDLGSNTLLALLLDRHVQPVSALVTDGDEVVPVDERGGVKAGVVLGIIGGVLAAGAAGTGGYLLFGTPPPEPVDGGVIRVQF